MQHHSRLRSTAGFTLVEIIIVVVIMISMTGFITANYAMYTEEKKLMDETTRLKVAMNQARTRAVNGDLGQFPCDPFLGYRIDHSTAEPQEYQLKICCNSTCDLEPETGAPSYLIASYDLDSNIGFVDTSDHTSTTNFQVQFRPFAQGATYLNPAPPETKVIVVRNTFINLCSWVSVSPIGVIEQGSLFSCF